MDELAGVRSCPSAYHAHGGCCRSHARYLAQLEDYLHIGGDLLSSAIVAERLGVSRRTVHRMRGDLLRATEGRHGAYQGPRDTRRAGEQNPRRAWADARKQPGPARVA